MSARNFFAELKRRNVYKVVVAYAVVAWLLIQVATATFPVLEIPNWATKLVILLCVLGFPIALVLAWAFELTPEGIKRSEDVAPNESTTPRTGRKLIALTAALAVVAIGLTSVQFLLRNQPSAKPAGATPAPASDKSVAVLPFENLSRDVDNAYFADGMHDEILTTLAKVADLKVVSRTSVMQFRDQAKRSLPEIAQTLKVAHVLEGSVQRSANRVRVTAQLIDARTDTHVWADRYDRDLADVFTIQSEIAQQIVSQLRSVLSPKEQAAIKAQPTADLAAYDLYLRARQVYLQNNAGSRTEIEKQIKLLEEAVARDPSFVVALCDLTRAHLELYWYRYDRSPARIKAAEEALNRAVRLQPDAGEVRAARAYLHYWGRSDYAAAITELEAAHRAMPNNADIVYALALVERRQGKWQSSLAHFDEALRLDPRNPTVLTSAGQTYGLLYRFEEAARILDGALQWWPDDVGVGFIRRMLDFEAAAELGPLRSLLYGPAAEKADPKIVAEPRLLLAFWERDYHRARELLAASPIDVFEMPGRKAPRTFYEGIVADAFGEAEQARTAFEAARRWTEAAAAAEPDVVEHLLLLAEIDARLGRREEAIAAATRAVDLMPPSRDAFTSPIIAARAAGVYALAGDTERALSILENLTGKPAGPFYGELVLYSVWDPLRSHPRFVRLLEMLAPKNAPSAAK